jgi:hypothetical protein
MMLLVVAHPQESTTWEDAYKRCVDRQGVVGGGLTDDDLLFLDVTEKFAVEVMNLLAQPVEAIRTTTRDRNPQANQQTRRR